MARRLSRSSRSLRSSAPTRRKAGRNRQVRPATVSRPPGRSSPATAAVVAAARDLRALQWDVVAPQLQRATVAGGSYVLVRDALMTWTAQWRPVAGRVGVLELRSTEALARAACDRHHLERHADGIFARTGDARDEALNVRDTKGAAMAWKHR